MRLFIAGVLAPHAFYALLADRPGGSVALALAAAYLVWRHMKQPAPMERLYPLKVEQILDATDGATDPVSIARATERAHGITEAAS